MNEKSGLCSAERCLRSLSRQIPDIAIKILAEDTTFIGKSDRLLALFSRCGPFYRRASLIVPAVMLT